MEGYLKKTFKETIGVDIKTPLRRMDYSVAMNEYGSDKPDTRFDIKLYDVKDILKNSDFGGFKDANTIKAITIIIKFVIKFPLSYHLISFLLLLI